MEDINSILEFGVHEAALSFPNIAQVDPGRQGEINASNQLMQQAVTYLQWYSQPHTVYNLNCRLLPENKVSVGDKVQLVYTGKLTEPDGKTVLDILDIDLAVYITGIGITYEANGGRAYSLQVSTTDRMLLDTDSLVASYLRDVQLYKVLANPVITTWYFTNSGQCDQLSGKYSPDPDFVPTQVRLKIPLSDDVLIVHQALLTLKTKRASLYQPISGSFAGNRPPTSAPGFLSLFLFTEAEAGSYTGALDLGDAGIIDLVSGTNGIDASTITYTQAGRLIGANNRIWGYPAYEQTFQFDLTEWLYNASGGLNQAHEIVVYNDNQDIIAGQQTTPPYDWSFGEVELTLELKITLRQDART